MNIEKVNISAIHFDPANVRRHDQKNINAIAASLKRFGKQRPLRRGRLHLVSVRAAPTLDVVSDNRTGRAQAAGRFPFGSTVSTPSGWREVLQGPKSAEVSIHDPCRAHILKQLLYFQCFALIYRSFSVTKIDHFLEQKSSLDWCRTDAIV